MKATRIVTVAALTCALGAVGSVPTWAAGRPLVQQEDRVLGSCGPEDDLLGSFVISEASGTSANDERLHLRLRGTVTRTGTGVVGRYAEVQMDVFGEDGSEKYVGSLSRMTVAGGKGFTLAGQAAVTSTGDFTFTKGLTPLVEEDWVLKACGALA
jgi:hypothetical protein